MVCFIEVKNIVFWGYLIVREFDSDLGGVGNGDEGRWFREGVFELINKSKLGWEGFVSVVSV